MVLKDQTEPTTFTSFFEMIAAYESDLLTPQLAKKIVEEGLVKLTTSIRQDFEAPQIQNSHYMPTFDLFFPCSCHVVTQD